MAILPCLLLLLLGACAKHPVGRVMLTTAYDDGPVSCNWERGSWKYLKLDFWNKYISKGKYAGRPYSGLTASGTDPHEPQPGLLSVNSLTHPWMIPIRILPWYLFPEDGTIAADTRYYPFGTRMYVPGYGWGRVEDRGGAIKGRKHIDLFFDSHYDAMHWGRKRLRVLVQRP